MTFSGSYTAEDVVFLLKVIKMPATSLEDRERCIQSGQGHYSEMIGRELPPSNRYLSVFHESLARNAQRLARNLIELASLIAHRGGQDLTLVSLARAGTPVGVLLGRILRKYFKRRVAHYSISVIRDRGIDENALKYILKIEGREPSSIVFVDGWTGKGVITRELESAIGRFNRKTGLNISPGLHVLTDLCGLAEIAPGAEDYLIPSSVLNSIISGLISRTILNGDYIGPDDFHGCLFYEDLANHDLSRWFVEQLLDIIEIQNQKTPIVEVCHQPLAAEKRTELQLANYRFVEDIKAAYKIEDENFIKPGIGEATRVLLRRKPDILMLNDENDPDVEHLLVLAAEKNIPIRAVPGMPYKAAAIIKNMGNFQG